MSPRGPRTPLPLRLAVLLLPRDCRDEVLGDLVEHWNASVRRRPWHRRVAWAWRQPVATARERLRRPAARDAAPGRSGDDPGEGLDGKPPRRGRLVPRGGAPKISRLDLLLGLRMLVKHPGLSAAGGLGIAVAVAVGVGFFTFMQAMYYPTIPLDEGHRLVGLENWDLERNNEERRSLFDFAVWRDEIRSVEDMTAFRTVSRNLLSGDGPVELVRVAEITPSGFRLARVAPLLGRPLVPADAADGAEPALVIGYDVWRTRFASDPDVVGREVRLGNTAYTVVGVMPEGFAFPMSHDLWVPLRTGGSRYGPGEGPEVFISGRLAPGATIADAQAELSVIQRRMAAEHPGTHARFLARVMQYHRPLMDVNQAGAESFVGEFVLLQAVVTLLLVLVCVNVAILVYARTATRRGEIAVRTALGASRLRVVAQLFAEALVLAVAGTLLGLAIARVGVDLGLRILETETEIPFWMDMGFSAPSLLYAAGLAVLAAVITGVLPGLRATGPRVRANLARLGSGGGGPGLGRTWTALVVVQVAVVVVGLPLATVMAWWEVRDALTRPTFDPDPYVLAMVAVDPEPPAGVDAEAYQEGLPDRYAEVKEALFRRLEAEPGVDALAVAGHLVPVGGARVRVAVGGEGAPPSSPAGHAVRSLDVGPEVLSTFRIPVVAGRGIESADREDGAPPVVVVDRAFVRRVLGDGPALGRRIRFLPDDPDDAPAAGEERWHEVVGVVADVEANLVEGTMVEPRVYRPLPRRSARPPVVAVRLAGADPSGFSGRFRALLAGIDPTLRTRVVPLPLVYRQERLAVGLVALVLGLGVGAVLLLSAAGVYALMSFAVTRRRREIGVRTALGAPAGAVIRHVLARAGRQVGLGVALGVAGALALDAAAGGELLHGYAPAVVPAVVLLVSGVGLLAALGPARRGLAVPPAEALAAE